MSHSYSRDQHPLVFVITHWINLLAMGFLALSGLYIHYPLWGGMMGIARGTHFFWMFVLLINLTVRVVLAFTVTDSVTADDSRKAKDWHNFAPQPENRHQLWPWIKYYIFLKKDHPISGKYGSLQKIAYVATVPLTLLAAWTGFCLWGPTAGWPAFQATTDWVATWFNSGGGGDPMNVRIVHWYTMWAILAFTAIHAYLANIYGFAPSKIMFAWKEPVGESETA